MDATIKDKQMIVNLTVHALDKYNFDEIKADVSTGPPTISMDVLHLLVGHFRRRGK